MQNRLSLTQSLNRLEELIMYLNSLWPENPTTNINANVNASLTSSFFLRSQPRSAVRIDMNEQAEKLRKVNSLLQSVDTSLQQIIEGLTQIYSKIKQHNSRLDLDDGIKESRMDNRTENRMMRQVEDQPTNYNEEVVENIFNYVNQSLFTQSLLDIFTLKNPKQLAIWLLEIETKLSVLPVFMHTACCFEPDITTCLQVQVIEKYPHAWNNIRVVDMENIKQTIGSQLLRLKRMMKIVTSSVVNQMTSSKIQFFKKIVFGLSFPYFLVADEQSELKCYKIWRKPKVENLNQVWNIPEMGAMKQCKKIVFASIRTSLFIYIPATRRMTQNMSKQEYKPEIFSQSQNYECIRASVLYYKRLKFNEGYTKFEPCMCFPCMDVAEQQDLQTIMIHLHGGGFVALSSETMQSYTRRWANQLKIPIFSIDYRKPPTYRFPVALEDCVTAYEFIIENIHKYFKIRPTNVILAGDSAGGNLAVSLYASLLMKNYPILPKGIFLAYPAVDLRLRFSPSRMNSFDDPILLPPLLLLCLKEYLGDDSLIENNPLASPILLTQSFIKSGKQKQKTQMTDEKDNKWPAKWPKTSIMVGKQDPLFDDSLRLLQRMTYAGVEAKLTVYKQFSHAFLSLDTVIQSCQTAINDSIEQIRKLM